MGDSGRRLYTAIQVAKAAIEIAESEFAKAGSVTEDTLILLESAYQHMRKLCQDNGAASQCP